MISTFQSESREGSKPGESTNWKQDDPHKEELDREKAFRLAALIADALEDRLIQSLKKALAEVHDRSWEKSPGTEYRSASHMRSHQPSDGRFDPPSNLHSLQSPDQHCRSTSKGAGGDFEQMGASQMLAQKSLSVDLTRSWGFRQQVTPVYSDLKPIVVNERDTLSDIPEPRGGKSAESCFCSASSEMDRIHTPIHDSEGVANENETKVRSIGDLEQILACQLLDKESLGFGTDLTLTSPHGFQRSMQHLKPSLDMVDPCESKSVSFAPSSDPSIIMVRSPTLHSCTSCQASGLEQLRAQHERDLTSQIDSGREVLRRGALYPVLRICGILPFDSGVGQGIWARASLWYQWAILFIVAAASSLTVASHVQEMVLQPSSSNTFFRHVHPDRDSSDLPLTLGSFAGMLLLGVVWGSPELCKCNMAALSYMHREGCLDEWKKRQRVEAAISTFLWLGIVSMRVGAHITCTAQKDALAVVRLLAGLLANTILSALVYCSMYISNALTGSIDVFGQCVMAQADIVGAIHDWNVLQAVLRTCSSSIQYCLFSLQATAVAAMMLGANDVTRGDKNPIVIVPVVLAAFNITRSLFRAAEVTDRCVRMPSLINSLSFGRRMDHERQYVVEYMTNSAAGFYVFNVRITSALALKFIYASCVIVFVFVTKVA